MTFEELNLTSPFLKALADLEYVCPTPIQEKAFPVIMSGRNMVGIAQTGTGKTFAYLLPLLRQLTFSDQDEPRILILAPTRELVIQILNEIKKLTKYTQLRSTGIYGDANIRIQKEVIFAGLDIIVATPGRLKDLAFTGVLKLKSVKKLVIDEVDEMFGLGFRTQLKSVLELLPPKRQNLMFSATLTPDVDAFIKSSVIDPLKIEIDPHGTPIEKIIQKAYHVPNFNTKVNLLSLLLNEDKELSRVLVFVGVKRLADRLHEQIEKIFPGQAGIVHSHKSHNIRLTTLKKFQDGAHRLIIASDIIARGMDITDVTHVINFDMPDTPGDYLHRIGRTGRADKDGIAISFITPSEQPYQLEIEKLMKKPIPLLPLPENLVISDIFTEEEKPANLFIKKNYQEPTFVMPTGAFHEKKDKNKKVNIGGPKIRSEKFDKNGKPKMTKKSRKTRF